MFLFSTHSTWPLPPPPHTHTHTPPSSWRECNTHVQSVCKFLLGHPISWWDPCMGLPRGDYRLFSPSTAENGILRGQTQWRKLCIGLVFSPGYSLNPSYRLIIVFRTSLISFRTQSAELMPCRRHPHIKVAIYHISRLYIFFSILFRIFEF